MDGLKTLGVAEAIEKDPDVLKPLFVGGPKALEVQDLLDLFSPCFSPPGSNRRRQENQALMFWKDWLIEVDVFFCLFFFKIVLCFKCSIHIFTLSEFPFWLMFHVLPLK